MSFALAPPHALVTPGGRGAEETNHLLLLHLIRPLHNNRGLYSYLFSHSQAAHVIIVAIHHRYHPPAERFLRQLNARASGHRWPGGRHRNLSPWPTGRLLRPPCCG